MYNIKEMKKCLIEREISYKNISDVLNISRQAVGKKISGNTPFTMKEVSIIKDSFNLSINDIDKIFFENEVA